MEELAVSKNGLVSCQPGLHIPPAAALAISLPNSFIERREEKVKSNKLRSAPKGCGFLEGWVGSGEEGRCLDSILLL